MSQYGTRDQANNGLYYTQMYAYYFDYSPVSTGKIQDFDIH